MASRFVSFGVDSTGVLAGAKIFATLKCEPLRWRNGETLLDDCKFCCNRAGSESPVGEPIKIDGKSPSIFIGEPL